MHFLVTPFALSWLGACLVKSEVWYVESEAQCSSRSSSQVLAAAPSVRVDAMTSDMYFDQLRPMRVANAGVRLVVVVAEVCLSNAVEQTAMSMRKFRVANRTTRYSYSYN
jgi:hypothetical protein